MYYTDYEKHLRGLDRETEIVEVDSELLEIKKMIDSYKDYLLSYNMGGFKSNLSSKEIEERAKSFLDSMVRLHDVKHISERDLLDKLAPQTFLFGNVFEEMNRVFNETEYVSPYEVPVLYDLSNNLGSSTTYVRPNGGGLDRLKHDSVLVDSIHLPRTKNSYSEHLYVRELMDEQIKTLRNSVKDINNDEVACLFFEYLSLGDDELKNRIFKSNLLNQISSNIEYLRSIKDYKDKEHIMYHIEKSSASIVSALKVLDLIERFNNGDMLTRQAILNDMQAVLDSSSTIDDLLEKHFITKENGQKILVKKIERN